MEKAQKYSWALPPLYLKFPTPESLTHLETREVTAACHPLGNSYHEWRSLRNSAIGVLATGVAAIFLTPKVKATVADFFGISQWDVAEKMSSSALGVSGIALTATIFTAIRNNQYHKCVNNVGNEFDRRVAAEQSPPSSTSQSAFWATTPFQLMGAAQAMGKGILAVDRHISTAITSADAKSVAGATTLFIVGASILRFVLSRGASAF